MTREESIKHLKNIRRDMWTLDAEVDAINMAITVLEQPEEFEWCHDCKEYDVERHCCHRWTKVIRKTVEEIRKTQPERKRGKWIKIDDDLISGRCSQCGWEAHLYEDDVVGMDYCPNCGARLEVENE